MVLKKNDRNLLLKIDRKGERSENRYFSFGKKYILFIWEPKQYRVEHCCKQGASRGIKLKPKQHINWQRRHRPSSLTNQRSKDGYNGGMPARCQWYHNVMRFCGSVSCMRNQSFFVPRSIHMVARLKLIEIDDIKNGRGAGAQLNVWIITEGKTHAQKRDSWQQSSWINTNKGIIKW